MTLFGLAKLTAGLVQRARLVERFGLTNAIAEVAVQGLLQVAGCAWVIARRPPHDPEIVKYPGMAGPDT